MTASTTATAIAAMRPPYRATVIFDVDNTLIDNDRAKADLSAGIGALLGKEGERRFWEMYEAIRRETGLVNIPLLLARFGDELAADPEIDATDARRLRFALADLVMGFPYRDYLFNGAMEAVRAAREVGQVAVLSEGDAAFQPHKIWRIGLDPEVDGNILVFDRKLEHLDELTAVFPADHYVLVEDKPDILAAVKRKLGPRITTVLVRQGKYAAMPLNDDPPPDVTLPSIAALTRDELERIIVDASGPPASGGEPASLLAASRHQDPPS
ncbi:MAG: hypothetical protein U0031_20880 [Thermomicrobiales bacterium]